MTIVVVAEKPSVARDIARVLGAGNKVQGFLEGNGYAVTWALGHLVHFAEPDDYGPQWSGRWSTGQLPMVPQQWKLKTARSTVKQFQVVKKLINDARTEQLICATDAGREGENIFRLIYEHAHCSKPYQRLWVSSLTDEAIGQGFRQLRPGSAFDGLAQAARARAQADWLVGMNLTRAYTVHNRVLCTIGRVQTPTLAMIVGRDEQIASFRKAFFYELVAALEEGFSAKYSHRGQTRIDKKAEAERLHQKLSPNQTGTVRKIEKKIRRNRPPGLYDLINLQREANRRFGFTAAQVLEFAQALYETHKLISYPRTESRHISEDKVSELPGILEQLEHPQAATALERLRGGHRLGKAYVDRAKLTDHHAILPTGKIPSSALAPALRKIYDLVVTRFVGVFLPDQVVEETAVTLDIGGATFVAKGSVVLEEGWKQVEQLLRDGRTARIEGFTSKAGKPFVARLKLGEGFKVGFDFADGPRRAALHGRDAPPNQPANSAPEPSTPTLAKAQSSPASLTCPKCGHGCIIEGRRGYGCNRFREGCNFVVWKEISGTQLTEKQIRALIGKGKTRLIKGFIGRSGNKFDARLRLDEQWKVVFEFPNSKRNST